MIGQKYMYEETEKEKKREAKLALRAQHHAELLYVVP